MTIKDGYILKLDLNYLLQLKISSNYQPYIIDIYQLKDKKSRNDLPSWVKLVTKLTTQSRLHGICTIPIIDESIIISSVPSELASSTIISSKLLKVCDNIESTHFLNNPLFPLQ